MNDGTVYTEASKVENIAGEVMISGPDGVDVSMTPEAASLTAARLMDNAAEAKGKQDFDADIRRRKPAAASKS